MRYASYDRQKLVFTPFPETGFGYATYSLVVQFGDVILPLVFVCALYNEHTIVSAKIDRLCLLFLSTW